jgi:hypothetical protein
MLPLGLGIAAWAVLAMASPGSSPADEAAAPVEWIKQDDAALELKLVSEGPCGGVLTVDSAERLVRWQGVPGRIGCRDPFTVAVEDVKSVKTRAEGGFRLELKKGRARPLVLVPLPHAGWFSEQGRGTDPSVKLALDGMTGPDGLPLPNNLSSVPTVARVDVPKPVAADTQKAVDLILERLSRPAPPAAVLREALFGRPVEAAIGDVLEAPTTFLGKAVRLRGRLDVPEGKAEYRLVDGDQSVVVVPDAELVPFFKSKVADWKGQDVEVVGAFGRGEAAEPGHVVSFWDCTASKAESVAAKGKRATLAALFAAPNAWLGETVRVVGKFRGRDLFGDFPQGARSGGDWVIKDDRYALWVIGRPAGAGFALDPTAVADTHAWVEVVGQPVVRSRRLSLRARSVALVPPPPGARVVPPRRLVGRQFPPAVVFSLPLDGEAVTPDTRFVIQFSKQMNEESFAGRVRLRYADQTEGGDFRVTAGYDDARRSLVVDPGTPLVASQLLEIQLLPGILDIDGMALVPRPGREAGEAVDVLRYRVEDGGPE